MKKWADDLSQANERLVRDASESVRVATMSNALGKINGVVKNDLQRLRQMGEKPSPANAVIPYHP